MFPRLSTAAVPGQSPSKYDNRLRTLGYTIGLVLIAAVLWFGFETLVSLSPGAQDALKGHLITTAAVGDVRTCERTGPVGSAGFGYWSRCQTDVRMDDGRAASVVLDRSLVTSADIGHPVPLREMCKRSNHTSCVYRGPAGSDWAVPVAFLGLVAKSVTVALCLIALVFLTSTIVGRPRLVHLLRRSAKFRD